MEPHITINMPNVFKSLLMNVILYRPLTGDKLFIFAYLWYRLLLRHYKLYIFRTASQIYKMGSDFEGFWGFLDHFNKFCRFIRPLLRNRDQMDMSFNCYFYSLWVGYCKRLWLPPWNIFSQIGLRFPFYFCSSVVLKTVERRALICAISVEFQHCELFRVIFAYLILFRNAIKMQITQRSFYLF